MASEAEKERVLVIRLSSLGDILLTAPAVRALRRRFADAEICFLVASEYRDVLDLIQGIDRIITFDRKSGLIGLLKLLGRLSRRFSIVVDLHNSARSVFLRTFTLPTIWTKARRYRFKRWILVRFKWNLYGEILPVPVRYLESVEMLGAEDDQRGLELRVPDEARERAARFLETLLGRSIVALCPGARHFTKRWPKERWIELGQALEREGNAVLVLGDANEAELVHGITSAIQSAIPMVGHTIPDVAATMERCAVVVSNDSGLMHVAAGVGVPVVAIFGPTVEEFGFFPFRARSEVVQQNLNVRPCSAMGTEVCREGHFRCMRDTTPEMVIDAVRRIRGNPTLSL